jgi:hypothetical protein
MTYLIEAHVPDVRAKVFVFTVQKTCGKHIAPGDTAFAFASEKREPVGGAREGPMRRRGFSR